LQSVESLYQEGDKNMVKRTFQPHKRKRKRTHGFLKKMRRVGGKRTLSRRRAKGRKSLINK